MEKVVHRHALDPKAISLPTGICLLWGINAVAIKVSNVGVAPMFGAGIRSVVAGICLIGWMKFKKMALVSPDCPEYPGNVSLADHQ